MARLSAGGTPEAVTGAATAVTSVNGVDARYQVLLPNTPCRVWQSETGQSDRLVDMLDANGIPWPDGVVTSDGFGQIPVIQLPNALVVNGVWIDPTDGSLARFWLPVRVGAADLAAAAPPVPDGTPTGYVRTVQPDRSIAWAAPPGLGSSAVTAVDF